MLQHAGAPRFTRPPYPHYQHMEVLPCRYLRAASALKSVILISKHLTREWWLLAGGDPCRLSRGPHLKKMTELLSDTYSTASVQWASSYYRRLLWSSSNFPKLHWPLVSAKLDWLEWFSLGRFVVQRLYTKSRSTRGWVGANMLRGAGWVGWRIYADLLWWMCFTLTRGGRGPPRVSITQKPNRSSVHKVLHLLNQ